MNENFGRYKLLEKIATGGMAEIYLSEYHSIEGFKKLLVIKKILNKLTKDKNFISMFIDEAKIAVRLNHRNIIQVFDFGQVNNEYYIAMEYVDGFELFEIFKYYHFNKEKIEPKFVVFIIMEILKGLSYAHDKKEEDFSQIIHRDISLNNIMISRSGDVKILDFGIAKITDKEEVSGDDLKGKLSYMAPEQILRQAIDKRADIYSLGIVAWKLLTGEKPFEVKDYKKNEIPNVIIKDVSSVNNKIPVELSNIIMKSLEKDKSKRYKDALEFYKKLYNYAMDNRQIVDVVEFNDYIKSKFEIVLEGELTLTNKIKEKTKYPGNSKKYNIGNSIKRINLIYFDIKNVYILNERLSQKMIEFLFKDLQKILLNISYKYNTNFVFLSREAVAFTMGGVRTTENDIVNSIKFAMEVEDLLEAFKKDYDIDDINISIVINRDLVLIWKIHENMKIDFLSKNNLLKRTRRQAESLERGIFAGVELEEIISKYFVYEKENNFLEIKKTKKIRTKYKLSSTAMVNRNDLMEKLKNNLIDSFENKKNNFNFLVGEAGVGKTRIALELYEYLNVNYPNFFSLKGNKGSKKKFSIFMDLLNDFLSASSKSDYEYKMMYYLNGLDNTKKMEILISIGYLLEFDYDIKQNLVDQSEIMFQATLMNSIKFFINHISTIKPVSVFLENFQFASKEDIKLLGEMIEEFSDSPIYFLIATRDIRIIKDIVKKDIDVFNVKNFNEDETIQLAKEILSVNYDIKYIPENLYSFIYQKTSGNPLFVEEIIKLFNTNKLIKMQGDKVILDENIKDFDIPLGLETILHAKFDTLEPKLKLLLQKASIFLDSFWSAPLEKLVGEDIELELDKLIVEGFIIKNNKFNTILKSEYSFKYSLLQEIVYGSILDSIRENFHLDLANILMSYNSNTLNKVVAIHFERAKEYEKAAQYYLIVGKKAYETSIYSEASFFYEKYISISRDDKVKFEVIIDLLEIYNKLSKYKESKKIIEKLRIELYENNFSKKMFSDLNRAIADFYFIDEDYSRGLLYLNIAKTYADRKTYLEIILKEAWYYFRENKINKALENIEEIFHIKKTENIKMDSEARFYSAYSALLSHVGEYEKALKTGRVALDKMKKREVASRIIQLNNIGEIYKENGDLVNAKKYYQMGLDLSNKKPISDYYKALLSNNLGDLEIEYGNYKNAINLLNNTINLLDKLNIVGFRYETHRLLALSYVKLNNIDEFEKHFKISEELSYKQGNNRNLVLLNIMKSDFYYTQNNLSKAKFYLNKAYSFNYVFIDKEKIKKKMELIKNKEKELNKE